VSVVVGLVSALLALWSELVARLLMELDTHKSVSPRLTEAIAAIYQVLNLDKKKKEDGIKIGVVTREMIDWQVCLDI
jgi:hypothetical protein